jgi:8-oxo-dGTP diphosphatase
VTLIVVAAIVERDGRVLVTRRQAGVHLEGLWEFPGGKCHEGESHQDALVRELREELDVRVEVGSRLFETSHIYPDRMVELHFYRCTLLGTPRPMLGQEMRWVEREALGSLEFPPADRELIEVLTRGA